MGKTGFLHRNHSPIFMHFCQCNVMRGFSLFSHPTPDSDREKEEHEYALDIHVNGIEAGKKFWESLLNSNGCV